MPKSSYLIEKLKNRVKQKIQQIATNPWFKRLARFGYVAKGFLYITIGLLATQVALGIGGEVTDETGVLKTIAGQPFGELLLVIVAVGLLGYAFWRLVQAILDPGYQAIDTQRIIQRLGYFMSGISYASLALGAIKLIVGFNDGNEGNSSAESTAILLAQPFGRPLLFSVGAIVISISFSYFYSAYTAKFAQQLKLVEMSQTELLWATNLGRFGWSARGSVYGAIGIFLIKAALRYNPQQAKGVGGTLEAIAQQPFGLFLLGVIAFGFIAFGIYQLVLARYRRIFTS